MLLTDNLLLNYKRCHRRTYLDIYGNSQLKDPEKEFLLKLKRENQTHIRSILDSRSLAPQTPAASRRNWQLNTQQTIDLMAEGVDCIGRGMLSIDFAAWQSVTSKDFQEVFTEDSSRLVLENIIFVAAPSLLVKQAGKSRFGDWQYVPVNVKLGRRPKPEYKLIAAYHAQILAAIQGNIPSYSQLILRQNNDYYANLQYWLPNMQDIVANCLQILVEKLQPEVFISRQKCSLCHWHGYCYETAKSQQHLSLIPGVTPKRYRDLQSLGVDSRESLAEVPESKLRDFMDRDVANRLRQQIISVLSNKPLVRSNYNLATDFKIPTGNIELYFDIEAEPERNLDYLLGIVLRDRDKNTVEFKPFLAEDPAEEGKIWQEFLDFVLQYPEAPIFHYSEYEIDTIKRLGRLYKTPKRIIRPLLSRFIDLHEKVTESVVIPIESYSLKAIANWLGFYWRDDKGSGEQSVCWYDRWLLNRDRSLLEAILIYNEDDCLATLKLKDWLVDFLNSNSLSS